MQEPRGWPVEHPSIDEFADALVRQPGELADVYEKVTVPSDVRMDDVDPGAAVELRVLQTFGGVQLAVRSAGVVQHLGENSNHVLVIVEDLVVNGISLDSVVSTGDRDFLSWTGMHANEIGLMANLGFAILLYTAAATARPFPRLTLFACAIAAAATAALTFSRGAFIGLAIIVGHYLITRRRTGQIVLALSITVGVALILPDAFVERATTGFHTEDAHAISAGRLDMIWRPLLPTFWEAPILGHGLGSTQWATPNIRGVMLPVGHPHSAYLGVLLDLGMVGVAIVAAFFWSAWAMFKHLAKTHADPLWRGVFQGGVVCLICLAVQGLTDDRFVPTYPQVALWLCYGLALGQVQSTCSTKRTQP